MKIACPLRKRPGFCLALLLLSAIGCAALSVAAYFFLRPAVARQSQYIPMRDGVRIAADIWLPAGLPEGARLPVILRATRYWRGYEMEPWFEPVSALMGRDMQKEAKDWTGAGYALVVVDVRGSGASSGSWPIMWSERETADLGEVVDWIVAQPWSNGNVGAYGVSYDGNTAEMLASLNHPAVKAVAPQFDDFDPQALIALPGGVYNEWFVRNWNTFNRMLDANDVCALAFVSGEDCAGMSQVMYGVRRVDADPDGAQLAAAVAGRRNSDVYRDTRAIEFREDTWGETGLTLGAVSPYTRRAAIERSGVPMYVWVSWLDNASVEGALARYRTFSNPQSVVIGAWNHSASLGADPFGAPDAAADPSPAEQFRMLVAFFDRHLKLEGAAPERGIRYYTMGEGTWKQTDVWPPAGFDARRWFFGPEGTLAADTPEESDGSDRYAVDWEASTGGANRWITGLAMADVVYPDRRDADARLLTYTSEPFAADLEITGNAAVTLHLTTTADDGAFHVYLEDVAPDGTVTYITEGMLRGIHRRIAEGGPPYATGLPFHSFLRADAMPLVPEEVAELRIGLYATSVLIRAGHRIRIALAGHDASVFARYPAEGTAAWTVYRNSLLASFVELPVRDRGG